MKPADEELELMRALAAEADLPDRAVALLRERGPDAADLASLASRLALQGVDVTPTEGVNSLPRLKWALAAAGGAATALLLWLALRAPEASPAPAAAPPPERATSAAVGSETAAPGSPARAVTTDAARARPPAPVTEGEAPSPEAQGPEAPAPMATPEGAPPGAQLDPLPGRASQPSSSPPASGTGQHRALAAAPTSRPSGHVELPPPSAAVPSEIELLRDARFAVKQSPARALELTEQHARLYPGGKLTQERELIAITALVSLGRRTAALSRAANFERAFPRSAYREQISELLR